MINPQWFELPMFRTNFHDPKDVRAIEVRLYLVKYCKELKYSTIKDANLLHRMVDEVKI